MVNHLVASTYSFMLSHSKSEIQIDYRALAFLSECLDRIRVNGGKFNIGSNEFFTGSTVLCNGDTPSPNNLHASLDEIRLLKSARECLCALTQDLDAVIATRCEQILPSTRQHGLASLPKEVFLLIFKQMLDSYVDPFDAAKIIIRDLSLVCKYFRDVVLEMRELWSSLDLNAFHDKTLELFLLRSGEVPLSVRFEYNDGMAPAVRQALVHKDRWHYLDAKFLSEDRFVVDEDQPTVFPSLKTLRVLVSGDTQSDDLNNEIFNGWEFPDTEDVEITGALPKPGDSNFESVKTFRYTSYADEESNSTEDLPGQILTFLKSIMTLHTLHLDLSFISNTDGLDIEDVELPALRNFTFMNWRWDSLEGAQFDDPLSLPDCALFINNLKMRNVENISLSIAIAREELDVDEWVLWAFVDPQATSNVTHYDILPNVTHFAFRARRIPDDPSVLIRGDENPLYVELQALVNFFPRLQVLSFGAEACRVEFSWPDEGTDYRNLRSLHITRLDDFWSQLNEGHESGKVEGNALEDIQISSNNLSSTYQRFKSIFPNATVQINNLDLA